MRRCLATTQALLAGVAVIALAGGTLGVAASSAAELSIDNTLSLDTIDIRIDQEETSTRTIVSDGSYPQSASITNEGAACYLRVRVDAEHDSRKTTCRSTNGVNLELWELRGSYFYYKPVLEEGASVDFTQELSNPWSDQESLGKSMSRTVTAEAVQARNFTPDYSGENPWGEIEPEECVHARTTANATKEQQ